MDDAAQSRASSRVPAAVADAGVAPSGPRPSLSVLDAIAITVGIVIGAGIFESPSVVAANSPGTGSILLLWLAGGLMSLLGVFCFAELASTYPHPGGNYIYLHRAFGQGTAFLFVWARMAVIQTGSMAMLGFVFADYAAQIFSFGPLTAPLYALLVIALFTCIHIAGVRPGKHTQNLLTVAEVLGVSMLIVCGLALAPAHSASAIPASSAGSLGLALVFVLLAYGGWNEAAFVSAEIKGRKNGIAIALLVSITLVTGIYLLVNAAMVHALGLSGMAASRAVGADLMRAAAGDTGARLLSVAVSISVLSSLNVTVMTGARAMYALGEDFSALRFLGGWERYANTPTHALLVQAAIASVLVVFGAFTRTGFKTMVEYTAPVYWLFFFLTAVALLVLRRREPYVPRPFRVPAYPLVPLAFCAVAAYLVYASLAYAGIGSLVGVGVLLAGVPVLLIARRKQATSSTSVITPRRRAL